MIRGGFGMGFFWDPKSRDFWDFFPKQIPNKKTRDFLGFLGLGFLFDWDHKIPNYSRSKIQTFQFF